jgi:ParB-like chromosome segregation protein Spo0J
MTTENLNIEDIIPDPLNPRVRMGQKEVKELADSISLGSPRADIFIRDGQIINGHLRLMAGLDAGLKVKVQDVATGELYYAQQNEDKTLSLSPYEEINNKPRRKGPR